MCMISNIGTAYGTSVPQAYPWVAPPTVVTVPPDVSREEFDKLKNEIKELKKLLIAAKEFDAATGQPDCEMDEKVELLKRLAKIVGVDLDDVLKV